VLARFHGAAACAGAASIVRVTSDCPLIDPSLIDRLVESFIADPTLDYASLDVSRFPRGLDCEITSRSAFDIVAATATDPAHREHVTSFLRDHSERFRLRFLTPPETLPSYRWCVDTPEDFAAVERLLTLMLARDDSPFVRMPD
jgi:spore coat polysaccharide biosynthesis protein SpsF